MMERIGMDNAARCTGNRRVIAAIFAMLATLAIAGNAGAFTLTVNSVEATPTSVNATAGFHINATTANQSNGIDAGQSVVVEFGAGVIVPSSISSSDFLVNGTSATSVSVAGQVITAASPVSIAKNSTFTIDISDAANIRNASTVASYNVIVTAGGYGPTTSSYTTTSATSTVSTASVTPSPSVESTGASYAIAFNVGTSGYLAATVGTITVTFPATTTVPASISGVTVNGTPATASSSGLAVTVTTPVTIENGGAVSVEFPLATGIVNPTTPGAMYTVQVATSSETTAQASDTYSISAATDLSVTAVGVSPSTVNAPAEYSFDFQVSSVGALTAATDTIKITFPENTNVPSSIPTTGVSVSSGGFSDDATSVTVVGQQVQIVTPVDVATSGAVNVSFTSSAGIENPSNPSNYTIDLATSADATVSSNPFTIVSASTEVSSASVTPSVATPSALSAYTIQFNTGAAGRLWAGSSQIELTFPSGTTVGDLSGVIPTVNGVNATTYTSDGTLRTITITVPASVTIGNSSSVTVVIPSGATGITNPATGNYTLQVHTSPEQTKVQSQTYSVSSSSPVTLGAPTIGTNTVNATSTFSVTISGAVTLSSNNGDYLRVTFPEGTVIPASIATGNVTVGAQTVTTVTTDPATRVVTVFIGSNNKAPTSLAFAIGAGIVQPSVPSSTAYTLKIYTSQNPVIATTSAYQIIGDTGSAISSGSASASPSVTTASNVAFTVGFTTSSTGKIAGGLTAGSSNIYLDFDANITVPASISPAYVQVDGTTATSVTVTDAANGIVKVVVPSGVTVDNSTVTSVVISANAGLATGASTSGSITVTTTSDSLGAAAAYTLNASQDLTVTQATVSPLTVNASAAYTIKFTTGSQDSVKVGDVITLTFPTYSYVPSSVSKSDVKVNNVTATVDPTSNPGAYTLAITSPAAVNDLTSVTVQISSNAGILNPTTTGSKTIQVHTTQATTDRTSPSYTVTSTSTTVSAATITTVTAQTSTAAEYTVGFTTGANGRLLAGTSTITITFPSGTTIGSAVNGTPGNTTVNGVAATTVSVNGQAVTITVPSTVSVGNSSSVSVVFANAANMITNPATATDYTLTVNTSVETSPVTSNTYTISNTVTTVTVGSVTLSDNVTRRTSQYTVSITPNTVVSQGGTVTIQFPTGTIIPDGSLSAADITIGGTASDAATGNSGTLRVTITVGTGGLPASATNIVIGSAIGLRNPSTATNYTLTAWTSQEPNPATSSAYTIAVSTTSVVLSNVEGSPIDVSSPVEWTWSLETSATGDLIANQDTVTLIFPADAGIPTSISTSKVTVNSINPHSIVTAGTDAANSDTVKIVVGSAISASTPVTIVFLASANVLSPPDHSIRMYEAYTNADPVAATLEISLPVELAEMSVEARSGSILLTWRTASEVENLGFHVWRSVSADGEYEQVNTRLIEGLGTSPFGREYSWSDAEPVSAGTYFYMIQDVAWDGSTEMHGPVEVTVERPEQAFALEQNAPNPFNPITSIRYSVGEVSDVSLVIYSANGQVIRTLVHESQAAGTHTAVWNGTDDAGRMAASGVYIYRLAAGGQTQVRRMILAR